MSRCTIDRRGVIPRLARRYTKRRFGKMVEPTAAASHHSGVLVAMGSLETAVQLGWKKLDPTLRWLAIQATGTRIGCSWCIDYGYYEGMHEGIDPAKVRAVGDWRDSDLFDDRERVVLEYAEVATGCPAEVSEELAARVRAHLSDAEFVELAAWVALENFRSRFNAGLGLRSQGFADTCEIPPRRRRKPHAGRCLSPRPTRPHSRSGARSCSASRTACWAAPPTRRTLSRTHASAGCGGATSRSSRCAPTSSRS